LDSRCSVLPGRAPDKTASDRFTAMQRRVIDRFTLGELSQKAAQLEIEHFWAGALRRAVIDGDIEAGSLMAGQSVGFVTREQSVAEILDELIRQALGVLAARGEHAADWAARSAADLSGRKGAPGCSGLAGRRADVTPHRGR